jgi:hypothetical protein
MQAEPTGLNPQVPPVTHSSSDCMAACTNQVHSRLVHASAAALLLLLQALTT